MNEWRRVREWEKTPTTKATAAVAAAAAVPTMMVKNISKNKTNTTAIVLTALAQASTQSRDK